jgi:O-antigen/teichoic acid export membrane protein
MHRNKQDVREPLLRIFSYLSAVAWPALCVLAILAHPIIVTVFGAKWVGSVGVAQILCAGSGLSLIGNISQTYLASTGAVRSNFVIQVISVPAFVVGVALGSLVSLEGAALGAAVTGGLMTGLSLEMLWRRIGLEWTAIARSVLPGIAITALTAIPPTGVALTMGFSDADLWRSMLIAGGGSAAAWLVSVYLIRHPLRHELASIMSWLARKLSNAAG